MGTKDIKPYRSKRINPYLNEPTRIGTGEPPKSAIPKIDEPLLKPPGGGGALSETVLEESEERRKRINPYLPEEQGPIIKPPVTVEPETKPPATVEPPTVEAPSVEPRPVEPERVTTVERSPDFKETGEYIVTLADGSTQRIYRDIEQFGSPKWHMVGDTDNSIGIGSTRAEAVSYLERSILEKVEPTISEKATEFEAVRGPQPLRPMFEKHSGVEKKPATGGAVGQMLHDGTFKVFSGNQGFETREGPEGFEEGHWVRSLFDPRNRSDRRLLVIACCATKTDAPGEIPALERYAGTLFQTLKSKGIPDDVDVAILSAEHGLIRADHPLSEYDTEMTTDRKKELLQDLSFTQLVKGTLGGVADLEDYKDVLIAGGKKYRDTIIEAYRAGMRQWKPSETGKEVSEYGTRGDWIPVTDRPYWITETKGRGIGDQRQQLGEWLQKSYYDPSEEGVVIETPKSLEPPTVQKTQEQWNEDFMREIRESTPSEPLQAPEEDDSFEFERDKDVPYISNLPPEAEAEEDVPYTESEEFLQHIAAVEAEERSKRLALEERIAANPWHAGLPYPTQKERRNALTEGFDDLVSKSLRASRKGIFPEVNVRFDRLPEGIKETGALTFYRGFPIQRVPIWDSDKKREVQMYVVSSPEEYDIEIERLGLEGYRRKTVKDKSMREPIPPGRGILRGSFEGPLVKYKYEAIKQVNQLWDKNPEAWNKVMKSLGYKYSDSHVFDAAREYRESEKGETAVKKAAGGFIDKPLYERTL